MVIMASIVVYGHMRPPSDSKEDIAQHGGDTL